MRDLRALFNKYKYECALYGHFGQGCIHTRINFDFKTQDGIAKYRAFISDAVDLVVAYGGSLSGEHGDGQSRAEFLPKMFGNELIKAFREFKTIWDPQGKMNPHKIVDPYRIDENLRLGADYNPPEVVSVSRRCREFCTNDVALCGRRGVPPRAWWDDVPQLSRH